MKSAVIDFWDTTPVFPASVTLGAAFYSEAVVSTNRDVGVVLQQHTVLTSTVCHSRFPWWPLRRLHVREIIAMF